MKALWLWGPIVGIVGLMVMGILADRRAASWKEVAYEWRDAAHTGLASAEACREQQAESRKLMNELAAQFCAERVTGCTRDRFRSLQRTGDGVYECRCER